MVAVISPGTSLKVSFYYNENKVKQDVAELLHAGNYPVETSETTENLRLKMLQKLAALNTRAEVNSVHISLNFSPGDRLNDEKLKEIAADYMERIGFGDQPFLVYRHHDAGHPHIHLLTTNIRMDGSRISLHKLGVLKSEPARKAIESAYGLVRAEEQKQQRYELEQVAARRVIYGRTETKKAIQTVLVSVLKQFRFSSLPELNAVLGQYNIMADRGSEGSRIYKNNGLVYRVLDEEGNKLGVPVKASAFYNKPTLQNLENLFLKGDMERQRFKNTTRNAIDFAIRDNPGAPLKDLAKILDEQGVRMVLRESKEGRLYGITYVDNTTRCVFNGSALGKQYSAKAMLERCGMAISESGYSVKAHQSACETLTRNRKENQEEQFRISPDTGDRSNESTILDELLKAEETSGYVPYDLRKKKKRRKKGLSR